jgi:hypothetical protein
MTRITCFSLAYPHTSKVYLYTCSFVCLKEKSPLILAHMGHMLRGELHV